MLAVLRSDRNGKHSTFLLVRGTLHPIHANPLEVVVLLSLYLAVLDDQSNEEQFIDVYNTCLLYTSPSPRDRTRSRMPSSA